MIEIAWVTGIFAAWFAMAFYEEVKRIRVALETIAKREGGE